MHRKDLRLVFIPAMACFFSRLSSSRMASAASFQQTLRRRGVPPRSVFAARRPHRVLFSSQSSEDKSQDVKYMELALEHARRGFGHTFPNPAVGCVLVQTSSDNVIGSGFHPRAGMPHAEVFALLEACGHVSNGVEASQAVVNVNSNPELLEQVTKLSETYISTDGPENLFGKALVDLSVTAYVTLEPCCHVGKTPPCATSFVLAGVDRVVVGFRDPNPRVDGGGVRVLEQAGVQVDILDGSTANACAHVVDCFVKRITPRENDYSQITGAMRSALRSMSGRLKSQGKLVEHAWPNREPTIDVSEDMDAVIDGLQLSASWLEAVDTSLWTHELVLLRLTNAVKKKKGVKRLGERIAAELDAHIAQVVGHTVLLYRPGVPSKINLQELIESQRSSLNITK